MRNLAALMKRVQTESEETAQRQIALKKDLKIVQQEIDSYNRQLKELDSGGGGKGEQGGTGMGGLKKANDALKSAIH